MVLIAQVCVCLIVTNVSQAEWLPLDPSTVFGTRDHEPKLITPALLNDASNESILLTGSSGAGLSMIELPDALSEIDTSFTQAVRPIAPTWTSRVGAIFLSRSGAGNAVLVNDGGSTSLLSAGHFNFSVPWGIEADVIRHGILGTSWGLEVRYFGVNDFSSGTPSTLFPSAAFVPYINPIGAFYSPTLITSAYQSSNLQNVELNARHQATSRVQCLVGFRYVQFDEDLAIDLASNPFSYYSSHLIEASNHLFGAQIGAEAHLWEHGRFRVEGVGKAGLYGNQMSNNLNVILQDEVNSQYSSSASQTQAAFIGELGLTGLYCLTSNLSFRASYQAYWLDGVALASGQIATSDPLNGTGTVNDNGSVVYHGAFLGLEFRR